MNKELRILKQALLADERRLLRKVLRGLAFCAALCSAPFIGLYLSKRGEAPVHTTKRRIILQVQAKSKAADEKFVAVLLPPQMADLMQRAQGRVTQVHVKVGQMVRKGDLLVELDRREREQDVRLAQAGLRSAKAQALSAGATAMGAKQLSDRQKASASVDGKTIALVSQSEREQAKSQAAAAGAHAAAAAADVGVQQERVNQALLALEETKVVAPFDGIVTQLLFEAGSMVNPGDVVARVIANGDGWRTRIAVPEEFADIVRTARRVQVAIDNRVTFADVVQRAVEVDPASRTFMLEANLTNALEACAGDCTFLAGREVQATLLP